MINEKYIIDIGLRKYLGLDEWKEEDHPRDDKGRFIEKGVETFANVDIIKQRRYDGIAIEKSEYAIISSNLNSRFSKTNIRKGMIVRCYTASYRYKIMVNDYNDYIPLRRWRVD